MAKPLLKKQRVRFFLWAGVITIVTAVVAAVVLLILYSFGITQSETLMVILAILLVIATVGSLLSFYVGRLILRPITALSAASQQIAGGDFAVCLDYTGGIEELRATYQSFNSMARELAAIETLRNDFVANVSHEFKTPLTAIEGYAMLLQDKGQTAEEQDECVDKILLNTGRLSSLVSNILMLSKLENQPSPTPATAYRLDEQIRQALVTLEPQWSEKNLDLDVDLDEVLFEGRESLLYHVWSNLISNAVKFSHPGGAVTIRLQQQPRAVCFSISDQGDGMSEEVQRHIFEKFYQGDASRRQDGNGLGLPLAKRVVELCGGKIEVHSRAGQGSAFRVTLPRQR